MLRRWSSLLGITVITGGIAAVTACGDDSSDCTGSMCAGTAGKQSTGGTGAGGSSSTKGGSTSTGGKATTGGNSQGGNSTGGASTTGGAQSTGGTATNTGGASTGGVGTGGTEPTDAGAGGGAGEAGASTGGTSTGGTSTGGASTGGTSTGGATTGGVTGGAGEGGAGDNEAGAGGFGGEPVIAFAVTQGPNTLDLAPGGVNWATVQLDNDSSIPIDVTLTTTLPNGASAEPVTQVIPLALDESAPGQVLLKGTNVSTGTGALSLTISTAGAVSIAKTFGLNFSDDMARNTTTGNPATASPWPKAKASSSQAAQPPHYAFDNVAGTFWVSSGTASGEGPKPEAPEWLEVDFGAPVRIGSVKMVPRDRRGPTAYTLEVSDDETAWDVVHTDSEADDAPIETVLSTPVTKRYLRMVVTGSRDPGGPGCLPLPCVPRNVQIIALEVRTAP